MKKTKGFTLIELMVVLAIVAILVSVAYPAYRDQLTRTRRAEGKAAVTQMAAALERCFTINSAYNSAACNTVGASIPSENGYYTVSTTRTATTYTATAVPNAGQATADAACGTLGVNQLGQRTATGSSGADTCWK